MYNIIYLDKTDRTRLQKLQEDLFSTNKSEHDKILEEIKQIKEKQKPLKNCNFQECNDLRVEIHDKFNKLQRLGKFEVAVQFKIMLVEVEKRMILVQQEAIKEAAAEEKNSKQKVDGGKDNKKNKPQNQTEKRNSGSSRWTTGIGNLD